MRAYGRALEKSCEEERYAEEGGDSCSVSFGAALPVRSSSRFLSFSGVPSPSSSPSSSSSPSLPISNSRRRLSLCIYNVLRPVNDQKNRQKQTSAAEPLDIVESIVFTHRERESDLKRPPMIDINDQGRAVGRQVSPHGSRRPLVLRYRNRNRCRCRCRCHWRIHPFPAND